MHILPQGKQFTLPGTSSGAKDPWRRPQPSPDTRRALAGFSCVPKSAKKQKKTCFHAFGVATIATMIPCFGFLYLDLFRINGSTGESCQGPVLPGT